ncbi:beta-microseminoprotein isoform X1 [Bos javanicus]|uniref:beta-microseminoprotein isoform X1 n=1 Tax=Bos javanicus TaxID=9906 RepID=UPI002AA956C1|nr:beta-microseminoprotein isoform X1 [Bos javanicus]
MNALLFSFVVLATFVTLCNAQCYFIPNESSASNARQGPLSMGFPRRAYWSGLPFPSPGDLPDPGIEARSPALAGCKDLSGVTHELKSDWKTENCESCHCSNDGIECCNTAAIPMGYDRDKCQAVFNKETCTYTVLEKKDPLKNCTVTAWVL